MEIVGIGTDIVECARVRALIEKHGETFLNRAFTPREIRFCQASKRATEEFSACWAAKEAARRALTLKRRDVSRAELEVVYEAGSAPRIRVRGRAKARVQQLLVTDLHLTLARSRSFATATAIAVRNSAARPRPEQTGG